MNGQNRALELFERFTGEGEAAIDQFIAEQISEELFIDYKRVTADGANGRLEQADKENLARAISGFGNSEGGVIVWGVDCRPDPLRGDVPTTKHPVVSVRRFVSYLEGAASGCTLPLHSGVRHHVIEHAGGSGYAVSLIPKSMFAPHQCIVGKYKGRYFIRTGSNFEQVPHGLLAGMFGQQPAPSIFHIWECSGKISPHSYAPLITRLPTSTPYATWRLTIRNHGVTIARDLFVNYYFKLPGPRCILEPRYEPGWTHSESLGSWRHVISPEGYRLAPAAMVAAVQFDLYLAPPFVAPLSYEVSFGCTGYPLQRLLASIPENQLLQIHDTFVGSADPRAGFEYAKSLLPSDQSSSPPEPE